MAKDVKYSFLDPPENSDDLGRMGIYRVVRLLGEGGMGQVFLGIDPRLERQVALKVLARRGSSNSGASHERFLREARSMAAIKHDNVATIYDVGEHKGTPFMAMELLVGKELDAALKDGIELSPEQVIALGRGIARGLGAAHAQGIIHRDVKPGNIWIESSGRPKLLDFGLAKPVGPVDSLAQRGAVAGTPGYLSPEQARDDPVDDRVDVYGLGVVLFELLTKTLPFKGSTVADMLLAILTQPAPNVKEINPDVPQPLADLVAMMLAKEPHDRPNSALDAERRLREVGEILSGKLAAGPQIEIETLHSGSSSARLQQMKKQRPRWVIPAIAGGAVAVLAGIALLFFPAEEKKPEFVAPVAQTQKQAAVTVADLRPLSITEIAPAEQTLLQGELASFQVTLSNQASSPEQNPATKLAGVRKVGQFSALLRLQPDGMAQPAPMLPLGISARQLPALRGALSVPLSFRTESLKLGTYSLKLTLEAPDGTAVSSSESQLIIARNYKTVPLKNPVRTWEGRGADTTVRNQKTDDFGAEKELTILAGSGKDNPEARTFLRFDLGRSKVPKEKMTQAVLAMTSTKDSVSAPRSIRVWGVSEGKDGGLWTETGEGHIDWETAPGNKDAAVAKFLGTLELDNTGGIWNAKPDAVRFSSRELDDLIRSDTDGVVTLYLSLKEGGNPPIKLVSKEAEPNHAPSLTLLED